MVLFFLGLGTVMDGSRPLGDGLYGLVYRASPAHQATVNRCFTVAEVPHMFLIVVSRGDMADPGAQ